MIHITAKFKCKDTDGDEHIVLKAACWDTGLNAYHNEYIIEMPGHVIKTKDSLERFYVKSVDLWVFLFFNPNSYVFFWELNL